MLALGGEAMGAELGQPGAGKASEGLTVATRTRLRPQGHSTNAASNRSLLWGVKLDPFIQSWTQLVILVAQT